MRLDIHTELVSGVKQIEEIKCEKMQDIEKIASLINSLQGTIAIISPITIVFSDFLVINCFDSSQEKSVGQK